jgi:hypothetical protein
VSTRLKGEHYAIARRKVRAWLAENPEAPTGIERASIAIVLSAIDRLGEERVCRGTVDRICAEQLKKYLARELDRARRGAA